MTEVQLLPTDRRYETDLRTVSYGLLSFRSAISAHIWRVVSRTMIDDLIVTRLARVSTVR